MISAREMCEKLENIVDRMDEFEGRVQKLERVTQEIKEESQYWMIMSKNDPKNKGVGEYYLVPSDSGEKDSFSWSSDQDEAWKWSREVEAQKFLKKNKVTSPDKDHLAPFVVGYPRKENRVPEREKWVVQSKKRKEKGKVSVFLAIDPNSGEEKSIYWMEDPLLGDCVLYDSEQEAWDDIEKRKLVRPNKDYKKPKPALFCTIR